MTLSIVPKKQLTNKAMTSTELAKMLGYEKKHMHEKIKSLFPKEIDGRDFRPSMDSRGYVDYYLLPEVESKMLVALCDSSYLRQITEYWVNKASNDNQPKIPKNYVEALRLAADQQEIIEKQQASLEHKDNLIIATNRASIEAGNILVREFCKSVDFVDVGQNKMYEWLRDHDYVNKNNEPYQKYIKLGYFSWKPWNNDKTGKNGYTLMITPRGKVKLTERYMNYLDNE